MKDREPPPPPKIPPKLRLHRSEKLGIPVLFALCALAVMGFFGPTNEVAEERSGAVQWSVEYPSRLRHENSDRVIVRLRNAGGSPVSDVKLAFDPAYIHAFSAVAFDPAPEAPYIVSLSDLGPGESRLVSVQLTADDYGSRRGRVSLSADGQRADVELATFVFP